MIEVCGAAKSFVFEGRLTPALQAIDLRITEGSFVAFVGPSGCGKSTLLNMIAGLVRPSQGYITHSGRRIESVNKGVGYMTQQDNLLPWRSAVDNVMLPLILKGMPAAQARAKALAMLERVGIERFARHFPSQLSGGMRKRASLAQLLVQNPSTILLDEPFGALDAQLKVSMQKLLLSLWEGSGKTLVFVTHDLAEAITLADQIVVFSGRPGQIRSIESSALPRPRDAIGGQFSPQFQALYQRLWSLLAPDIESALTGVTS
ncbi:MAG: hypothetical protein RLZZ153_253 [Pseudomonadota bacterium]|jgi:NitT/TauT family transport system ATP-binding protein